LTDTEQQAPVEDGMSSDEAALAAAYDAAVAGADIEEEDQPETEAPEPKAEGETAEAEPEGEAEPETAQEPVPEPPTHLPASLRNAWAGMSPELRETVDNAYRDISGRNAELGRTVKAVKPTYDALVHAAQQLPSMRDMTPEQIAKDVFAMAVIQNNLNSDPVGTILNVAKRYGAVDGLRAALAGQAPGAEVQTIQEMHAEIRDLRRQLSGYADPKAIDERVERTLTVRSVSDEVSKFAASAPHWGDVENIMPSMVDLAKARLGDSASAKDILSAAYDMAVNALPDVRAKAAAAKQPPARPDPQKIEGAAKAKGINVKGAPTGGRPQFKSHEEELGYIYDRATRGR